MTRTRLHNALFLLAIAVVLAVTAWAVALREEAPALGLPALPPSVARPEAASSVSTRAPGALERVPEATRRMIERGELSREPARYYRREAP